MEEFRKLRAKGYAFSITFDKEGLPDGDATSVKKFDTFYAYLAKLRVPITIDNWAKDVSKDTKEDMWREIKRVFKIATNDGMKKTLGIMGNGHRGYRSRLAEEFIHNFDPQNPKNPCDLFPITPKQWEEFCIKRGTPEFEAKRNKGKELRKRWDMPHRMGSSGYKTAKKKWKPTDKIVVQSTSEEVGSTSITIGDLEPRSQMYFRGRAVSTETNGTYTIPQSDKTTCEAFRCLPGLTKELNSGSIHSSEV